MKATMKALIAYHFMNSGWRLALAKTGVMTP
jgi:hypothetical protein